MEGQSDTILGRYQNPLFKGFQASNIVEGTVVKVHTDDANNVTMTADVVTIKNEFKPRVPMLFPYASADGTAGVFAIPSVGDRCVLALAAGNSAYIIGYHAAPQLSPGRSSAALAAQGEDGQTLKGTFAKTQLIPGALEMRTAYGNRVLVHPGGSIVIDARKDLYSFYDAVSSTLTHLSRSHKLFTAGGFALWEEGREKAKRSMGFNAQLFTKAATQENLDAGALRGGAKMSVLFSESANHFLLEVTDQNGITSRIAIGPNGVILSSSDGAQSGSITVAPSGNFSLAAGDPGGLHTQLDLAPSAIAIAAYSGPTPIAAVTAETNGKVQVSAQTEVTLSAPRVVTKDGLTALGALGGMGAVRRIIDQVIVFGVTGGSGSATGFVLGGSATVSVGG